MEDAGLAVKSYITTDIVVQIEHYFFDDNFNEPYEDDARDLSFRRAQFPIQMQKGSVKLNLRREQKMIGQIIARVNSVEDEIRDAKQYPMRIE